MIPLIPRKHRMERYNTLPFAEKKSTMDVTATESAKALLQRLAGESEVSAVQWRRYGKERRRQLLQEDEVGGGNNFDLNYGCRIQGYFGLSEKIISQFTAAFNKSQNDLGATYVMGNRLVHFLSEALPRHPDYMSKEPSVTSLREKSFKNLVQIKKRIEALALRIDEEELNKYIMHDFDPLADDDDSSASSFNDIETDHRSLSLDNFSQDDSQWESFDGWSFDLPERMTNPSKHVDFSKEAQIFKDQDTSSETVDTSNETFSSSERSYEERSEEQMPIYDSFGVDFLKRIASEDVRYETDSEAVDSWAQESEIESAIYSVNSTCDTSYDPARIALREILANKRRSPKEAAKKSLLNTHIHGMHGTSKENKFLEGGLSQDSIFDSLNEEDIWPAFSARHHPLFRAPTDRVSL